nr:hypothetical transcript [Hymenolepis microstoma]
MDINIRTSMDNSFNSTEKLLKAIQFHQREHRLTLLEKRQLFRNIQLLEDRILGLTEQMLDLKDKYDKLLRSKALCKIESDQIRRKYVELRSLIFPNLSLEKVATHELMKAEKESPVLNATRQIVHISSKPITSVACHPVKELACCVGMDGKVSFIQPDKAAFSTAFCMPKIQFTAVSFSPDVDILAISSLSGHIMIGQLKESKELIETPQVDIVERYQLHRSTILSLAWHCAGDCLATGSLDGYVRTFALERPRAFDSFRGHRGGVNSVHFLPNSHLFLSASSDRRVILWDARSKRKERQFEHEAPVIGTAYSKDGTNFVSCDASGAVLQWDSRNAKKFVKLADEMAFGHGRNCVLYSPDENYLLTGNTDGTMSIINILDKEILNIQIHRAPITSFAFCQRGDQVMTSKGDIMKVGYMREIYLKNQAKNLDAHVTKKAKSTSFREENEFEEPGVAGNKAVSGDNEVPIIRYFWERKSFDWDADEDDDVECEVEENSDETSSEEDDLDKSGVAGNKAVSGDNEVPIIRYFWERKSFDWDADEDDDVECEVEENSDETSSEEDDLDKSGVAGNEADSGGSEVDGSSSDWDENASDSDADGEDAGFECDEEETDAVTFSEEDEFDEHDVSWNEPDVSSNPTTTYVDDDVGGRDDDDDE